MSKTITDLIHKHIETWSETDKERRRNSIQTIYTENCDYVDPLDQVKGWSEIDSLIERLQNQFPNFVFQLSGPIDIHHHVARFSWHYGLPNSPTPEVSGMDVVIFKEGRICSMYGFFHKDKI